MSLQEIVDFIYKRINGNNELKKKMAEEVVKECKKKWIKINKNKDIKIFEEIKNDPSLDNKKNKKVKGLLKF